MNILNYLILWLSLWCWNIYAEHIYSETLERVQMQYCRDFLGVNSALNKCVALGECGKLPLCFDSQIQCKL